MLLLNDEFLLLLRPLIMSHPDELPSKPTKPLSRTAQAALESETAISKTLESIIRTALHAVNTRNFNSSTPAWSSFSSAFHNNPDGPAFQQYIASQHAPFTTPTKPKNLLEFLAIHRNVSLQNPKYELKAVDLCTTMVNEKAGYAQVIMTGEATGIPEGVVRRTISAFEFRCVEGKWWCVNTRTLPGMDPSSGPSGE